MMFKLVIIGTGRETTDLLGDDGKPAYIFETGAEAAKLGAKLTSYGAVKYGVRPYTDGDNWRQREIARADDGTYTRVPWADEPWCSPVADDHFAHISQDKECMVAYTESAVKGAADRQTRVRPGRYLERYFGNVLPEGEIRRLAVQFTKAIGGDALQFAATADEIERVYTEGPDSCMSHATSYYRSDIHPTRVYAAGDLAIAYLERDGRITARCVAWPAKKIYSVIYGDNERLRGLLDAAGFVKNTPGLSGARLLRHECNGTVVAPYVDELSYADDKGGYLIIGAGCVDLHRTDGLGGDEEDCEQCEHCQESCDADDMHTVRVGRLDSELWCNYCAENSAMYCEATDACITSDIAVTLHDGTVWGQWYFDDNGGTCEETNERYPADELHYDEETGETVCGSVYTERLAAREAEAEAEAPTNQVPPHVYRANETAGQMALAV